MPLKTILVHLADDEECERRLKIAVNLCKTHKAHLRALFITKPLGMPAAVAGRAASSAYIESALEASRARAKRLGEEFNKIAEQAGIDHTWIIEDGEHLGNLRHHAHVSDLVIVSQSNPAEFFEDYFRVRLAEKLVMCVGAPVLVLPRGYSKDFHAKRVMVCWKTTTEAVRAVRGALAFLKRADLVTVLSIGESEEGVISASEVVNYLERHDVKADAELVATNDRPIADLLIDQATQRKIDLMVMGAYGHQRMLELLFGGVTRQMFEKVPIPLIMAN